MDERITVAGPPNQLDKRQWRRSANPSVRVARPFDPAPLMDDLRRRVTSDRFRFAVFGDTHHSAAFPKIMRLVREAGADFVVTVGDLVNLGGGREGPLHYGKLEAEAGTFLRSLPVWAAVGNHDADSRWDNDVWNGFANFKAFFNLPPYYGFRFRNAAFVVLSWMLPDEAEMEWLERQLAARDAEHLFVVQHWPLHWPRAIVIEGDELPLELRLRALLAERRVTAHFSGHAHIYLRTVRDGVAYLVVGVGGQDLATIPGPASLRPGDSCLARLPDGSYIQRIDGRELRLREPKYSFVLIDVTGDSVTGKTMSAEGELLDEFPVTSG